MVAEVAAYAAFAATFNFCCVLDGVVAIEGLGPKASLC
jgi:hypothetical protein